MLKLMPMNIIDYVFKMLRFHRAHNYLCDKNRRFIHPPAIFCVKCRFHLWNGGFRLLSGSVVMPGWAETLRQ